MSCGFGGLIVPLDILERAAGGFRHEFPDHENLRHQNGGEEEEGERRADGPVIGAWLRFAWRDGFGSGSDEGF
jgi:hypothetical protein